MTRSFTLRNNERGFAYELFELQALLHSCSCKVLLTTFYRLRKIFSNRDSLLDFSRHLPSSQLAVFHLRSNVIVHIMAVKRTGGSRSEERMRMKRRRRRRRRRRRVKEEEEEEKEGGGGDGGGGDGGGGDGGSGGGQPRADGGASRTSFRGERPQTVCIA
ncbi:hypothetical protein V1478_014751 [Vespula squamosa]|uniref:Uncharacterized protein n=1 Tax=Vespula squamosa TaxID=30214 RepID=A0ABD2A344_VESSQ